MRNVAVLNSNASMYKGFDCTEAKWHMPLTDFSSSFFFSVCAPKLRPLFNNGHVVSIMVGILRLWSGGTLQVK